MVKIFKVAVATIARIQKVHRGVKNFNCRNYVRLTEILNKIFQAKLLNFLF